MKRTKLSDRNLPRYSKGEEIFNMVSHIAGGALGITATPLCVIVAALHKNVWGVVSGAIFGATMIMLYCMSSIYHGLSSRLVAKKVFQVIDHCTIFVLIAGTYTPFLLCTVRSFSPVMAWILFGVIWGAAALGITLNAIDLKKYQVFSMICYLAMGWCILSVGGKTLAALGYWGSFWLILGGVLYTLGAVLYLIGAKRPYFHSVFHIFCVLGSFAHFISILFYVM